MSSQTHGLTQSTFLTHNKLPIFVGLPISLSVTIATFAAISSNTEMAILIVLTPSLLVIGLAAAMSGKAGLTDLLVKRLWGHARWPWLVLTVGLIPAIAYLAIFIRSFLGGPPASLRTT